MSGTEKVAVSILFNNSGQAIIFREDGWPFPLPEELFVTQRNGELLFMFSDTVTGYGAMTATLPLMVCTEAFIGSITNGTARSEALVKLRFGI